MKQPTKKIEQIALLSLVLAFGACDAPPSPAPDQPAPTKDTKSSKAAAVPENEAAKPEPVPPPKGAVADRRNQLWVQDCAAPSCPSKVQSKAAEHCAQLKLGDGVGGWRLPSKSEAEKFSRLSGLAQQEGYHWTASAFDADAAQFWIVDPSGKGRSTTIPGTRKPMRARCVRAPLTQKP